LRLGPVPVDLAAALPQLARSATIDVLRARETRRAARALASRYDFRGARIVWPHASLVNVAVPDVELQRAGAITHELVHGALAEAIDHLTFERTASTVKILWTELEATCLAAYEPDQQQRGGYVPRPLPPRRPPRQRSADEPIRILVLSNYLSTPPGLDSMPFLCYQPALMHAVEVATRACRRPLELRWRPHPSDDPTLVAETARQHVALGLVVSHGSGAPLLADDLSWADVLITSVSTSIVEALAHPIPILVHDIPSFETLGILGAVAEQRRFRNATELETRLPACLDALGGAEALAPEAALRRRLFGPTGEPRSLRELFWPPSSGEAEAEAG
jgi:hypothetical protein